MAENQFKIKKEFPVFKAGDTITVHYKIIEGNKERIQQYRGVVLQRQGSGMGETFTVRKMSGNVGVERIFPVNSPFIDKIEVNKHGRVRRAKIFYFRGLTGKKARIQERRMKYSENDIESEETYIESEETLNQQEEITGKSEKSNDKPEEILDKQEEINNKSEENNNKSKETPQES